MCNCKYCLTSHFHYCVISRNTDEQRPRKSTIHSTTSTFTSSEDPFVVLESSTSTSKSAYASPDLLDPLERISKLNNSGSTKPPHLKSPPRGTQILKGDKGSSFSLKRNQE